MTALKVKGFSIQNISSKTHSLVLKGSDTSIESSDQVSKVQTIKGMFHILRDFLIVGGDFA